MSKLTTILRGLLAEADARPGQGTRAVRLQKGLNVAAKLENGTPTLCLYRDAITTPSQDEALTCGQHIGWPSPVIVRGQTARGLACLFVSRPLTVPRMFCPGVPCASLPAEIEAGRLLGLAVDEDWITVIRHGEVLHWRAMRSGDLGSGTRGQFEAYLRSRQGRRAA